jgi:RNA polymerase sigma-70 factor (ECF subfamily)
VARLLAGEEAAFAELFAVQVPRLFRTVLARVDGDADAAEEVVQAALVQALPKLHTWRGEASLLTWLTTFCLHDLSARFRRRRRLPRHVSLSEQDPEVAAALELLAAGGAGPEGEALRGEVRRLVAATLDRLPARYADVLEWKYAEGLSVAEIALRLETGAIAVQSLLARARAAFRDGFRAVGAAAGVARFAPGGWEGSGP